MIIQSDCNSHSAKVQVDEINGEYYVHSLESSGSAQCLMEIFSQIRNLAKQKPVRFLVDVSNPKALQLVKSYVGRGARIEYITIRVE